VSLVLRSVYTRKGASMYRTDAFAFLILTMALSVGAGVILSSTGFDSCTSLMVAVGAFISLCLVGSQERMRIRW